MHPSAPPPPKHRSHSEFVLEVVASVILVAAALVLIGLVWYPTTQQPNIALTDASYTTESCVPVGSGFGNRYAWTFTLINTGTADGSAAIRFDLDGYPIGYNHYPVSQRSQIRAAGAIYGSMHPSPAECGASETPGIALASVRRIPEIDERMVLQSLVSPLATLAFAGIILGILNTSAHRHGFSLFLDLGGMGWAVSIMVVFVAGLFSSVLTAVVTAPYNYPPDWTPAIVYGIGYGAVGTVLLAVAHRVMMSEGLRRRRPAP